LVPETDQVSFTDQERSAAGTSESVTTNSFRWIERDWEPTFRFDESVRIETQLFKWVASGCETVSGTSGRPGHIGLAFVLVAERWAGTGPGYEETDAESKHR